MNKQTGSDQVPEPSVEGSPPRTSGIQEQPAPEFEARSEPLKSNYNSTFIVLVLSIAAILAVILLIWS